MNRRNNVILPKGWMFKRPYLQREDGAQSYILDANGRIDRALIATILENYGYFEHAERWHLTPEQIAAPNMKRLLSLILTRLDLEPPEAIFPCSALREDIRTVLKGIETLSVKE